MASEFTETRRIRSSIKEGSKGESLKRLSSVGRVSSSNESSDMGSPRCEVDDELRPKSSIIKRFRHPRKFSGDCKAVDHGSVPRKLRSAMKKRNAESSSREMKLVLGNNGGCSMKKSKSMAIPEPITKDEEEVVDTLNALAIMFPKNKENELGSKLANVKPSLSSKGNSSKLAFEDSTALGKYEESKSLHSLKHSEAQVSLLEESGQEVIQFQCLDESEPNYPSTSLWHNTISERKEQTEFQTPNEPSEPFNEKPSHSSFDFNVQSDLCLRTGSKQHQQEDSVGYQGKPEIEASFISSKYDLEHAIMESKNSGLPSSGFHGAGTWGPSSDSYPATTPVWLCRAASEKQGGSPDNGFLAKRDTRALVARNKSWKSCSTHVYISYLIKALQTDKRQNQPPVQLARLTPNEGLQQSVLPFANEPNTVQLYQNGAGTVFAKRLLQDQPQASSASCNKPCFDFLSLSAGGRGGEAAYGANPSNKLGNGLEPSAQLRIPYLQCHTQNHTALPFPLALNQFSSSPLANNLPPPAGKQVQVQPLQCLGSSPHLGTSASEKQQQQQTWAPLAAAQYRSNWQNERQEPSLGHFAQSRLPPSHSSLEVLGPKYTQFFQQPCQLLAGSSPLPGAWTLRQHHLLPSGYERDGVGPLADTLTITLQ